MKGLVSREIVVSVHWGIKAQKFVIEQADKGPISTAERSRSWNIRVGTSVS